MTIANGKAYATLTEVKNKIGDVFTLADEYGEIVITSYNKPKYKIIRLSRTRQETEPEPEQVAEPAGSKPAEISKPEAPRIEPPAAPGIVGIFSAIGADELWQRDNKREQLWVKQIRTR